MVFLKSANFLKKIVLLFKILPFRDKAFLFIFGSVFILSFGGMLIKINKIYSVEVPDNGGKLNEGVIGAPRFINPLLSVSDTDRDLVKLIYASLLENDGKGNFFPVLAEKYEVSENGLIYTFYLKKNIKWHDGSNFTSEDVVFTVKKAKDPSLNSFQRANWEGVEAEKVDDFTVKFYLKKPYAPFLENTTMAIMPKHIWENMAVEEISLSNFNIEPVGLGPYQVKKIYRNSSGLITSYKLKANKNYVLSGPYIKNINIYFYSSEEKLLEAVKQNKIQLTGFISPQNIDIALKKNNTIKKLALPRVFGLFFNSSNNLVFENKEIRKALSAALDKKYIINEALNGYGAEINSPIPKGSIGFLDSDKNVLNKDEKIKAARVILEESGWRLVDGVYQKKINNKNVKLSFSVSTSNSPSLMKTAEIIKNTWENMGAKVELKIFEIGDLNQTVIRKRNYEILLFGEILGRDPDPFAFWHSSQRSDPGLNIAMYANNTVDKILEDARIETDITKRIEKYKVFQEKIIEDEAAIFLYSPYFIYLTPLFLNGINIESISSPQERFSNIYKWYVYKAYIWPIFLNN